MTDMSELTLEEKAALGSGSDFWHTQAIDRLGVPAVMLTDGPHGLRKQLGPSDNLGMNPAVPATCFPPAVALASSFDVELAERVGAAIGTEAVIEGVAVVLGPGVNIKRSPLCGRNFEYFSEDPVVAAAFGTALVKGIQSQGVGASLKHFAANNQETDRMRISADVDPRPLREVYLRAFQRVVQEARPETVMCSYNRINGRYASEDPWLLTRVLREEWGFEGLVVSDWGAVDDRVAAAAAGLDLEMPSSGGRSDAQLAAAVRAGALEEQVLDRIAERVLALAERERPAPGGKLDVDGHHALAREAAARSIVLLKNEDELLPLAPSARIAVIGEFARTPRYQGAGSSHIAATRVDTALEAIGETAQALAFAPGFRLDGQDDPGLAAEAVRIAGEAELAVVFLGLPDQDESEGFDRGDIRLPAAQLALLDAVVAAQPRTVVVLSNGGVVELPFAGTVPAIVEGWLLGQAGGSALADVLFGRVNPSGRLAETIPLRLEDTPAFLDFPGEAGHVRYGEGLFVGYRWYEARRLPVAFPFGHGLSYTSFDYGTPSAVQTPSGDVEVTLAVSNTGQRPGREVVQLYASLPGSAYTRPPRELKAFANVPLEPGETREVTLVLRRDDLAVWDQRLDRWILESGSYRIEAGASSADIRASTEVVVSGDEVRLPLTWHSSLAELLAHPVAGPAARAALPTADEAMLRMISSIPLRRLVAMGVPEEGLAQLIALDAEGGASEAAGV